MSDLIRVVDLEVWTFLGVPDVERNRAQKLLVSIEMAVTTFAKAAGKDDVSLTVNYFDVAERVKAIAARRPRKLLETLVEEMATDLLKTYPIEKLGLEIKKFVLPDAGYVSVKVERKKS
jgi:FolB domain-containing protein